ncbi:MAG TPA: hypothetical protein VMY76_01655 [Gemmatimonadales bacterium]|nr:hypothetical protein [Gemmatimonadales bacterium]
MSRHNMRHAGTGALVAALLAGCGGASTANPPTPSPAPEPGAADAPAPTTPGRGPAVTYKPVRSASYRLERHDSLSLQYPGGATQEQVRDRIAFLRVTVGESSGQGPYQVTIVLDSLQALEGGQPASPDSLAAARGTKWTGSLSSTGGLSALAPDRTGTLPDELTGRLRLLFPALPAGGVREGMEWTDTTKYRLTADAFPGEERAVITYRASANDAPGMRKGITLESSGSYDRTGTRLQADQELQMASSGTRRGAHHLGLDGVLISAQGNEAGDMTITVPTVGQTVPVKQSGSYSITSGASR